MDVFLADASAGITGDLSLYEEALALGVQIPQTDRPDLLLPLVWGDSALSRSVWEVGGGAPHGPDRLPESVAGE